MDGANNTLNNNIISSPASSTPPPILIPSLTTCIVGGGNSAHVLVPFLKEAGHQVRLLTRRPNDWHDIIYCRVMKNSSSRNSIVQQEEHTGRLDRKSSDPADVIPDADIIILCMPVHQYRPVLNRLAPFINKSKEVFLGTIYGQGGFNWMVHVDVEKQHRLNNIVTFAVGSIPWICRKQEYGHSVFNYGGKVLNIVAVTPHDKFAKLDRILLKDLSEKPLHQGVFKQACCFLSLTMSVDNQIIHPARCYGLWLQNNCHGKWSSLAEVPYFYRDCDKTSAEILHRLDLDYTRIRAAIRKHFPERNFEHMLSYLELENLNHSSGHVDALKSLQESTQLASIQTPTVAGPGTSRLLDTDFRFFTDDTAYGLLIAKWIAEQLQVATPCIDEVIIWAQGVRGEHFLDERDGTATINKQWCLKDKFRTGIPEAYGLILIEDILD